MRALKLFIFCQILSAINVTVFDESIWMINAALYHSVGLYRSCQTGFSSLGQLGTGLVWGSEGGTYVGTRERRSNLRRWGSGKFKKKY